MKRILAFTLSFLATALLAARCSTPALTLDSSPNAADSGDATVIIEGCGSQPVVGYTYCRKTENTDASTTELTFHAPVVQCEAAQCVTYEIFFPDGSPSYGVGIPKGETKVKISFSKLLKRDTFTRDDRGFWPVIQTIHVGVDGGERLVVSEGEIRLRVLRADYVPLNEVPDHREYAWRWRDLRGYFYRLSTSGRAYTGR